MVSEVSLPCLQELDICPYLEPHSSVHAFQSCFFKIHFNIILLPKPRSSEWHVCCRLPHHTPVRTSLFTDTFHMPRPHHPNSTWWAVQMMKVLTMQLPLVFRHFAPLRAKHFAQQPFSNIPSLCSSLNMRNQVSHPYETARKIVVMYISIFKALGSKREDKRIWIEC